MRQTMPRRTDASYSRETHELTELAVRACLVASDAVFNVKDFLTNSSRMALIAVRDCEKELDRIERHIDQQLPAAITQVKELEARELLACHRFSMDLERIADLLWWVGQCAQNLDSRLPKSDSQGLLEMLDILEKMLKQIHAGFTRRELDPASYVLRADHEMDRIYRSLFRRHLQAKGLKEKQYAADVLLMAQALERAGDHATNLAEELFRLIEGHSLRHKPKRLPKD
jgi:phosphate transport system protein